MKKDRVMNGQGGGKEEGTKWRAHSLLGCAVLHIIATHLILKILFARRRGRERDDVHTQQRKTKAQTMPSLPVSFCARLCANQSLRN